MVSQKFLQRFEELIFKVIAKKWCQSHNNCMSNDGTKKCRVVTVGSICSVLFTEIHAREKVWDHLIVTAHRAGTSARPPNTPTQRAPAIQWSWAFTLTRITVERRTLYWIWVWPRFVLSQEAGCRLCHRHNAYWSLKVKNNISKMLFNTIRFQKP